MSTEQALCPRRGGFAASGETPALSAGCRAWPVWYPSQLCVCLFVRQTLTEPLFSASHGAKCGAHNGARDTVPDYWWWPRLARQLTMITRRGEGSHGRMDGGKDRKGRQEWEPWGEGVV